MKKFKFLICSLLMILALSSCEYHSVEAGYVGVKVEKFGSDKGIQRDVVGVGRYFLTWNEDIYDFPTFQVNYTFTRSNTEGSEENEEFTFQTQEGMECSADLGVALHFETNKIPVMFGKYRKGVDEIRGIVVRNEIRDALNRVAGSMPVESAYGVGKGHLIDSTTLIVNKRLNTYGIVIDRITILGNIRIPQEIKNALNSKVQMSQEAEKAKNEVAKAEAKAQTLLVQAKAEAEANRLKQQALTPELLQQMWIQKWDGRLPVYGVAPQLFKGIK